ncbi:MAG: glycoside hydrolase family 25 protein [Acetatifactor sp.]|nr:glycoside hydrolase family 25 protein [Acetatifactor sp.]
MRLDQDMDKGSNSNSGYPYAEDRLNKTKKRKNGKLHSVLIIFGYLAALVLIMCVVGLVNTWITDKIEDSAKQMTVSVGAELLPEDKEVTLTEAELNAMLEEAAANAAASAAADAVTEAEAEKLQAAADARAEVLDGIRAGLETGDDTVVEVLRPFYPDHMVVVSNNKFHFVPINRELKLSSYSDENLNILESGEYQYMDGDQVISHKGIDVSRFQGNIDWQAVAGDGVEFAIIRVANRGYGTGKLVVDEQFEKNIKGAVDAGIHVGVYIYSQAIDEQEVVEEANLVMEKLAAHDVNCPIVFDVEKTADPTGRMNQISVEERTNLTLLFCQTVEAAGYKPIIYHNMEMGALMLDVEPLEQYDKWLAYYNDNMYYPYEYKIWQYSDKGRVSGISSNVDMNICFEPFWE